MTDTSNLHEPTPQFREYLEWQVRSAVRRESRFSTRPRGAERPRARAVWLLAVGLALGAGAAVASAQVTDARQRDLRLATEQADRSAAQLMLHLRREQFAQARARFESGVAGRETLEQAETELRRAELQVQRLELNIAEIRATGLAPRDEITAPLVDGRDFVRERLNLDLVLAQQKHAAAERAAADVERRVQVGIADAAARLQAQLELARASAELQLLVRTLELRAAFLRQGTAPEAATLQLGLLRVQSELQTRRREHDLGQQRLQSLRQRHDVGQAEQVELLRAELAVLELSLQVAQLERRLAIQEGLISAQKR